MTFLDCNHQLFSTDYHSLVNSTLPLFLYFQICGLQNRSIVVGYDLDVYSLWLLNKCLRLICLVVVIASEY